MPKNETFVCHIYSVTGDHKEKTYKDIDRAISFCKKEFLKQSVYKVKLWDLSAGGVIEPNNPNANALIAEWV